MTSRPCESSTIEFLTSVVEVLLLDVLGATNEPDSAYFDVIIPLKGALTSNYSTSTFN